LIRRIPILLLNKSEAAVFQIPIRLKGLDVIAKQGAIIYLHVLLLFSLIKNMQISITKTLTLFAALLLVGCGTVKSERRQFKEVYIDQFKLTYFRKLLTASFNHSEAVKNLIEFDRSGFTEPVLTGKDYNFIDSLVYLDNQVLVADSIRSIGTVAEGAEGKHVFNFILTKMQSKWLDRLAYKRYKHLGRKVFAEG
jgi:hypothetical protein